MRWVFFLAFLLSGALTLRAYAGEMGTYAFPQKGQTPEQQKQDESACAQWAQGQTGLSPEELQQQQQAAAASQQQAAQEADKPRVARKLGKAALTGAALGGIDDAMDDGAGKGAAMGATVGASRMRSENLEKKADAQVGAADAQAEQAQANTQEYTRAYCACMEGKGYSIR
jgi:hypothetical protein